MQYVVKTLVSESINRGISVSGIVTVPMLDLKNVTRSSHPYNAYVLI